jgi:tetratricopeptide (TPR) repeat protein
VADWLMAQSRELAPSQADEINVLRQRAAQLYRRAFDLGYTFAANAEGQRRRDMGDIEGARAAFLAGARVHQAGCALALGLLEEEEQQDLQAARAAYGLAVRLDPHGGIATQAQYRLGRFYERDGKLRAAAPLYRLAMGSPGTDIGSAEAAVALGRLRSDEYPRDKAKNAFLRGMELDARLAALPYVEFIVRKHDIDAGLYLCSQEKWLERFFAEPLFKLGQFLLQRHRGDAEKLFRQALERRWAPAAVELYKMLERSSVSDADATLALTSKHDRPFLDEVAQLFRDNHRAGVADKLEQMAQAAPCKGDADGKLAAS